MGRILVMTGHTLLGEGLVRLIHGLAPAWDVELASSLQALFDVAHRAVVDIFLLAEPTYALPILSTVYRIRSRNRRARIIALQTRHSWASPFHLFRLGVFSVLPSDSTVDELDRAVLAVKAGQPYIGSRLQTSLAAELYGPDYPHLKLTHREFETLALLIRGFSASETARRLAVSAQTVSAYKISIRRQLNAHGLSDMVRYGLAYGLLEDER
ncbi:MAG: LuxR C-terminal-related transcriptional regulator [Pseudomonadota bacterium]